MTITALRRSRALAAASAVLALVVAACGPTGASPSGSAGAPSSAGAGGIPEACPDSQPAPLPASETRTVTFSTEKGDVVLAIGGASPIAAGNFVALAECGYYTGTVFHRIAPGFVIQGGDGQYGRQPNVDFDRVGTGGPGYTIEDEPVEGPFRRGTIAMARTPRPDSQGSQFFILLDDQPGEALLDTQPGYAILGAVVDGMDIVDEISLGPNAGDQNGNLALAPVTIESVTVTSP